jgi:hypothetical protein
MNRNLRNLKTMKTSDGLLAIVFVHLILASTLASRSAGQEPLFDRCKVCVTTGLANDSSAPSSQIQAIAKSDPKTRWHSGATLEIGFDDGDEDFVSKLYPKRS